MKAISITGESLLLGKLSNDIPELEAMRGVLENNAWHNQHDVQRHVAEVIDRVRENLHLTFIADRNIYQDLWKYLQSSITKYTREQLLIWSALLHDIAKPKTIVIDRGKTRCPNHEVQGAIDCVSIVRRLGFDEKEINQLASVIRVHNLPAVILTQEKDSDKLSVRFQNLQRATSDYFPELLLLALSDVEASHLSNNDPNEFRFHQNYLRRLLSHFSPWKTIDCYLRSMGKIDIQGYVSNHESSEPEKFPTSTELLQNLACDVRLQYKPDLEIDYTSLTDEALHVYYNVSSG